MRAGAQHVVAQQVQLPVAASSPPAAPAALPARTLRPRAVVPRPLQLERYPPVTPQLNWLEPGAGVEPATY